MIRGKFGEKIIAQCSLAQIMATDFNQEKQTNQAQVQNMERSKILYGVGDPINLIQVKISPPSLKGFQTNDTGINFNRKFKDDLVKTNYSPIFELQKIREKSRTVAMKYLPNLYLDNQDQEMAKEGNVNVMNSASTNHSVTAD